MRTKKFIYNSIFSLLQQLVMMLVGFIVPRVMLVYYGSEINGIVSSILQLLGYVYLIEAGLTSAAIYSLYKPLTEDNFNAMSSILTAAKKLYNKVGIVFSLLSVILAIIYPMIIHTSVLCHWELFILVLILSMTSVFDFFILSKYQVLLTADQKIYILSIFTIITVIFQTAIIIISAKLGFSIILLKVLALLSTFVKSFLLYYYVKRKYPLVRYDAVPDKSALNKRWDSLYLQILGSIQVGAPIVIATFFLNLKLVSVYAIYSLVNNGVSNILSVFISGLFASFGDVIAKNEQKVLQQAYNEFETVYYMLITIIYSTAMIIILPFIDVYTSGITDQNYHMPLLGLFMVINGLLFNIKTPQGMLVISAGLFRETRLQTTIQGIICIAGSLIFVHFFGLVGILIGPILSNLYRDIDLIIFIPKNVTHLKILSTIKRVSRIVLLVPLIVITFSILTKFETTDYYDIFILGTTAVLYSTILVIAVNYLLDKTILDSVLKRLKIQFFKRA